MKSEPTTEDKVVEKDRCSRKRTGTEGGTAGEQGRKMAESNLLNPPKMIKINGIIRRREEHQKLENRREWLDGNRGHMSRTDWDKKPTVALGKTKGRNQEPNAEVQVVQEGDRGSNGGQGTSKEEQQEEGGENGGGQAESVEEDKENGDNELEEETIVGTPMSQRASMERDDETS